jgi:hypothetical protein
MEAERITRRVSELTWEVELLRKQLDLPGAEHKLDRLVIAGRSSRSWRPMTPQPGLPCRRGEVSGCWSRRAAKPPARVTCTDDYRSLVEAVAALNS